MVPTRPCLIIKSLGLFKTRLEWRLQRPQILLDHAVCLLFVSGTGPLVAPPAISAAAADFAAYMPLRGEFDVEWDDDAEQLIGDMDFSSNDTEAERATKLQVRCCVSHEF